MIKHYRAWFLSIRFKPLIVGIGPILVALCLSSSKPFPFLLNGVVIFCVLCIQIATHFFNDALDFLKGADSVSRKGVKRAVQQKMISPSQLLQAGYGCLFLAALGGVYLVFQGGWPVLGVGIISLFLAYFYTGGSYALAYTGLADFFVLLFFGVIPVAVVFYLNEGYWTFSSFVAGLQCGFLALTLLIVNNLRDIKEDGQAQKKTLIVRFGKKFGFWEWTFAHYLPSVLCLYWFFESFYLISFLPLILLPFSVYIHFYLYKALKEEKLYSFVFTLNGLYYLLFVSFLSFRLLVL